MKGTNPATAEGLALGQAGLARLAAYEPQLLDTRAGTLQHRPAPIAHLDVHNPYALAPNRGRILPRQTPLTPLPMGDPGAFATSQGLEDR